MSVQVLAVVLVAVSVASAQSAGSAEDNLTRKNITLPVPSAPAGNYVPAVRVGNLLFLSSTGPVQSTTRGKVGKDVSREEAYQAARATGLNALAIIRRELGSLDRVRRVVRVTGLVNAAPGFTELPQVINGFSDLMVEVFGEAIGKHARSAVGVAELPNNYPIAVEVTLEVDGAAPQDRVLGLLKLPEVFGNGPCHPFEPVAITLHAAPGGAPLGSIRVDQHWSFAPHGGCEGLQVNVHGDGPRAELPTLEYANESPAAIVLATKNGWFKVRLATGTGWLHASPRDRFMPLADLFSEYPTLTALTGAHRGALFDAPGVVAAASKPTLTAGTPVRVLEIRAHDDQSWLQVALMSHSVCDVERSGPPEVVGLGWVAAHAPDGEPAVWFSSRGC